MKIRKFFVCFLLVWVPAFAGTIEIKCPEFCACDVFHGLKRATCQSRKLVSIELNIPVQAEILDISHNQISKLDDKIFLELGLTNLKLLNISRNMVKQIHFNGFKGLETLKTLDLSYNALEYFTRSWFESLQSLEELYLRGNKLRSINEEARIDIPRLRMLDISSCSITRVSPNTFRLTPNLETLDVSGNFLHSLGVDVLEQLSKLKTVQVQDNNFDCQSENEKALVAYVKRQKISCSDSCVNNSQAIPTNQIEHRFEKMRVADDAPTTPLSSSRNSWMVEDNADADVIKRIEECRNASTNAPESDPPGLLMEIIQLSPWTTLSIVFFYGLLCGMVLSCIISICATKKQPIEQKTSTSNPPSRIRITQSVPNLFQRREKRYVRRSNSVLYKSFQKPRLNPTKSLDDEDDYDETLIMNEFDLANSTPMVTRKIPEDSSYIAETLVQEKQ